MGEDIDEIVGRFDDVELQDDEGPNPRCDSTVRSHDDEQQEEDIEDGGYCEGDLVCAICLGEIPLEDLAMVKGCDHIYCTYCILQWTLHKDVDQHSVCPTCKQPFSYLMTYRGLDGSLNDFPMEESVVLLRRAEWFESWVRESQNDACCALLEDAKHADDTAWMDEYDEDCYWKEDEEMEAYYFSSAAGKARIVLGNRRFGQGGYISGGHRQARPVKNSSGASGSGSKKKSKNKGLVKAACKEIRPHVSSAIKINTPNAQVKKTHLDSLGTTPDVNCYGTSPPLSGGSYTASVLGSSPSTAVGSVAGSGRRAKRNARRHAEKAAVVGAGQEE